MSHSKFFTGKLYQRMSDDLHLEQGSRHPISEHAAWRCGSEIADGGRRKQARKKCSVVRDSVKHVNWEWLRDETGDERAS